MSHRYLKDSHWHYAFLAALVFWFAVDYFFQPADPRNLFRTPEIILFAIILYPVLEEFVFRGVIQRQLLNRQRLRRCLWGISGANVATSILFSALHFIHQPPLMAALIFFPSLIFGYFWDRHRSVVPSIYLHVFYNAGFLFLFSVD